MDNKGFVDWLHRYGRAWEAYDLEALPALFAEDARYEWTPFDAPLEGIEAIRSAWDRAICNQRDVRFTARSLSIEGDAGIAHWTARYIRPATGSEVRLDGVLLAEFGPDRRCRLFREWWHSTEGRS